MPKNNSEKRHDLSQKEIGSFVNNHFADYDYRASFTDQGFAALKSYLGNVWRGQPKIYTAPFAKGDSMSKVLEDWTAELASIQTQWPTLYDFEMDLAKKVGPMSVQKPLPERLGDIAHYYLDISNPGKPISSEAIASVLKEFSSLRGLRLRSVKDTLDLMKKSTNSGSPAFTKRRNVAREALRAQTRTIGRNQDTDVYSKTGILHPNGKSQDPLVWCTPAVVGWRGQEGGPNAEDTKQRVVWMFPFTVNVNELQVYQPLIEKAQEQGLVPAWISNERVDESITRLFDSKGDKDLIVCTDFSRFDQHFNEHLANAAEAILSKLLASGSISQEWLANVFPAKYYIPLTWQTVHSEHTFKGRKGTQELIVDNVSVFKGRHGMGSGSGGTNVDETLVHRALQYEAAQLAKSTLNPNSQCLGDDGILSYPGITVEDVVKAYESHGQVCNLDKQYASTQDCVYLRRWHHKDYRVDGVCVGVYSTCRALGRLRYLERFMDPEYWSPELVALRQLSILENCKFHPLREEFVQFCMKRDKYHLGLDLPGFLDNIQAIAEEATDHMQDFLGYTKTLQGEGPSGISEWWIVRYLKSLG